MHHDEKLRNKLVKYIEDAYAMENHIVEVLEKQVQDTQEFPNIQMQIQHHLDETREHQARMMRCLESYGQKPSGLKSALSNFLGNVMGALGGTQEDALAMNARNDYAVEHFEIATYGLLIATAQAYGDQQTVQACLANLRDEVEMANWLENHIAGVGLLALQKDGITLDQMTLQSSEAAVISGLQSIRATIQTPPPAQGGAFTPPASVI
jgi:ferritin-like metal-binding protein YciE